MGEGNTWFRKRVRKTSSEVPLGHGHRSQVLAEHLSKVPGASMIWCSLDGEPLTPIVHADDRGVEILGLGCLACHEFFPAPAGILTNRTPAAAH